MTEDFAGKIKNYVELSGSLAEKVEKSSLSLDQLEKLHDLISIFVGNIDSLTEKNMYNFKKNMEVAISTYKGYIGKEFNVSEFIGLFSAVYDKIAQFKYDLKVIL